ncbi:hypothetical protein JI664_23200 [Rhodobacter sp. NTK016B]|uniref:hypothetical protein n=1 Tax=Rhodobacter sp. NTK016B TaxID=2759676 RepID=UPI001A90A45D|nr:hypothetical protein [Rhodobacter sp. NTK016B]MBN8294897.1 hypothetical protein [Rhodobacter sp. NTK016B]
MSQPERPEPWHLDRRIPIATLAVLLAQAALGLMWLTTLGNMVDSNVARLSVMEQRVEIMRTQAASQAVQLGRIEEGLAAVRIDINRLITSLERNR